MIYKKRTHLDIKQEQIKFYNKCLCVVSTQNDLTLPSHIYRFDIILGMMHKYNVFV